MTTRYEKLEIALRYYLKGARYHTALKAFEFARRWHCGFRKDGVTPEFQHQIEIAQYCITLKGLTNEEEVITVALLHDVMEDYPQVTFDEVKREFGTKIAESCRALNKNEVSENKYFDGIASDPVASIVKGADRIHNVNSMVGVFSKEKQKKYIQEVNIHFLPMLKKARKLFPEQLDAYFNIMHMLRSQVNLLEGQL